MYDFIQPIFVKFFLCQAPFYTLQYPVNHTSTSQHLQHPHSCGQDRNRQIHNAETSELQTQYSGVVGRLHPTGDLPTVNTAF